MTDKNTIMTDRKETRDRVMESRSLEQREAQLRETLQMDYIDALHIPEHQRRPGYEYLWGRESYMGMPDNARLMELQRKGWTPVPADRFPDRCSEDFLGRQNHMKGYVYHKGLILFERPIEFCEIERKAIDVKNNKILTTMPATDNFMGEPTIPARFIANQVSKSRAPSFGE